MDRISKLKENIELMGAGLPLQLEKQKALKPEEFLPPSAKIISVSDDGKLQIPYEEWKEIQKSKRKDDKMRLKADDVFKPLVSRETSREITSIYSCGNIEIAKCNDDTIWLLSQSANGATWTKFIEKDFPEIPQG